MNIKPNEDHNSAPVTNHDYNSNNTKMENTL